MKRLTKYLLPIVAVAFLVFEIADALLARASRRRPSR